jgi:hypothetical protein
LKIKKRNINIYLGDSTLLTKDVLLVKSKRGGIWLESGIVLGIQGMVWMRGSMEHRASPDTEKAKPSCYSYNKSNLDSSVIYAN